MRRTIALSICALAASLLAGSQATAATVGVSETSTNGSFFLYVLDQAPGQVWTIRTSNLTTGSDTVINIQNHNDPQGGFIAGDDDSGGGRDSLVTVPSPPSARKLRIVVRSYTSAYQGKCNVTASDNFGTNWTLATQVDFGGGGILLNGALPVGSRISTGELQRGAADTVMLVLSSTSHAVAFDDDDGVGNMSWVQLGEACGGICTVVLANYGAGLGTLGTRLVWDEEAISQDPDQDGLGNTLEALIGTNPGQLDTDLDGIPDGSELVGQDVFDSSSSLIGSVKFPFMGASPTEKDLFVEADWVQCTATSCNGDINKGRLTEATINSVKQNYLPVRLHVDNGEVNPYSDSRMFDWGAWGGASSVSNDPVVNPDLKTGCEWHSPERDRRFHFALSFGLRTGHAWATPGGCLVTSNSAEVFRHELGHTLGIIHGGRPDKLSMNFKAHYFSFMNYPYQASAPGFSTNSFSTIVLNPTALDERAGVGNNPTVFNKIAESWCPGGVPHACVNTGSVAGVPLGAVDWNRDGIYAPAGTLVQGAATLFGFSNIAYSRFNSTPLMNATMSWVSVGGSVGDQLWLMGHDPGGALQMTRLSRTSLNTTCGASFFSSFYDERDVNCAGLENTATPAPGARTTQFGFGLAEVNDRLLVVWAPPGGAIRSSLIAINAATGAYSFASDVILPGNVVPAGDVTALTTATGVVRAWAKAQGRLKQWVFQGGNWSGPIDQEWADGGGGFISPLFGIGATRGYEGTTQSTYAAIVTSPTNALEFARQESTGASAGKWTRLTSSWSIIGTQPFVNSRPGLAYQHTAGQVASVGRFYVGFTQSSCTGPYAPIPGQCSPLLLMTEGNTSSLTQRLKWLTPVQGLSGSATGGGVVLLDDPTRDVNLRALVSNSYLGGDTMFLPVADGIVNGSLRDMDDWAYVKGALRAALSLDNCSPPSCQWPSGVLPPGLP